MSVPQAKTFESTFSLIMLALELKPVVRNMFLWKAAPYSFTVAQASKIMHRINYNLQFGPNTSEMVISMPPESMQPLLQLYIDAHLLHCPVERCKSKISSKNTTLQPTAKGVAVVQKFCEEFSIKHDYDETLFKSALNTMKLVHLRIDPINNRVVTSEAMLMVLWNRMMGTEPRPWTDKTKRDGSPYYHQWLLHPHGNAISQYYDSEAMRIFKDVSFENKKGHEYKLDYILTGKCIWQWILDCTNVMDPAEAEKLAVMFVHRQYVRRVDDKLLDEITCADDFPQSISRATIYRIAYRGHLLCDWQRDLELDTDVSLADHWLEDAAVSLPKVATFEDILTDPGLMMLFERAIEKRRASENLDFVYEFMDWNTRYKQLDDRSCRNTDTASYTSSWQALAGIIYNYISPDSPTQINIPEDMRVKIMTAVPKGRLSIRDIQESIAKLLVPLNLADEHIRGLLTSMVPQFVHDPALEQIPPIKKDLNPFIHRQVYQPVVSHYTSSL